MEINKDNVEEFLSSIDTFLIDCDGVLWLGEDKIEGVSETIKFLKKINKKLLFVTNNSTKSRKDYTKKFLDHQIDCKKEDIFCSAYAAAAYLKSINFDGKAYVVGQSGITHELEEFGIPFSGMDEHTFIPKDSTEIVKILSDEKDKKSEIKAVIVGHDINVTYTKLAYAHHLLVTNKDCLFISTNNDFTYPVNKYILPEAGALVSALEVSTGRSPLIIGKPYSHFLNLIKNLNNLNLDKTCMIGDRLDTDIQFGLNGGVKTLLVLSGVTTEEKFRDPKNQIKPHYFMKSLGNLKNLVN